MTSLVYAMHLYGLEPPPEGLATGATREEKAGYRKSVSEHRQRVRNFCDSRAAHNAREQTRQEEPQ